MIWIMCEVTFGYFYKVFSNFPFVDACLPLRLYISRSTINALSLRWAPLSSIVAIYASSGSTAVIKGAVVV